jgi:hypothetical protein
VTNPHKGRTAMEDPEDFEIISTYSRAQALADGVLVDVSAEAKETGILLPTVITDHLHHVLEDIPPQSRGQDYRGRLHDVLWMAYLMLRTFGKENLTSSQFPADFKVIIDGKLNTLWLDADGAEGFTIMFPEDY